MVSIVKSEKLRRFFSTSWVWVGKKPLQYKVFISISPIFWAQKFIDTGKGDIDPALMLKEYFAIYVSTGGNVANIITCVRHRRHAGSGVARNVNCGGLPSLASSFPSSSPLLSPPLLTGSGGITPGKNFEVKGARRWVLEHFGSQN